MWRRRSLIENDNKTNQKGKKQIYKINIKIKITEHNKKQRDSLKMLKDRIKYRSGIRRQRGQKQDF